MRKCSLCEEVRPFGDFSKQKTNPAKFYAWCNPCRNIHSRPGKAGYADEVRTMHNKAIAMRKFDDKQAAEWHRLYKTDKVPVKELAQRFDTSQATIYKTLRRVK